MRRKKEENFSKLSEDRQWPDNVRWKFVSHFSTRPEMPICRVHTRNLS